MTNKTKIYAVIWSGSRKRPPQCFFKKDTAREVRDLGNSKRGFLAKLAGLWYYVEEMELVEPVEE